MVHQPEENWLVQDLRTSRLNRLQSREFKFNISSRPFGIISTDAGEEFVELSYSISLMLLLSNGFSSVEEELELLLCGERSGKVITHCTTDMSLV